MLRAPAVLFILLAAILSQPAKVEKKSVSLEYDISRASNACDDRTAFEQAVSERLGYEPFVAQGSRTARVEVTKDAKRFVAQLSMRDSTGQSLGQREFQSDKDDCIAVLQAVQLALVIAIEPRAATGPIAKADIVEEAPVVTPIREPNVQVAAPLPESALVEHHIEKRAGFSILPHAGYGLTPSLDLGASAEFSARFRAVSFWLGPRADFSAGVVLVGTAPLYTTHLLASIAILFHVWKFSFGPCVGIGGIWASSTPNGLQIQSPRSLSFLPGGRLALDFQLNRWLGLKIFSDIQATVFRQEFRLNDTNQTVLFRVAPVSFRAGVGVTFDFFVAERQ